MQNASAREMEERTGKPRGWLDAPPDITTLSNSFRPFEGTIHADVSLSEVTANIEVVAVPPTITGLLDSLREQLAAQPESAQRVIIAFMAEYLTKPDPELATSIELLLMGRNAGIPPVESA